MFSSYSKNVLFIILTIVLSAGAILAQSTSFTYQGQLSDGGTPANGSYDLQFALFDTANSSVQIGQTQTVANVSVTAGIFTVTLDFGANAFTGAGRALEIRTRPSGSGPFTVLTPRQLITSTPYAVRSLNTATADVATNAQQLGGAAASQYVKTDDSRLSNARVPTAGSTDYIQNTLSPQPANFNIAGSGTVAGALAGNTVNAGLQYNFNGQRVLGRIGSNGIQLGVPNTPLVLGDNAPVGIGTASPTEALTVAGTVQSTSGGFKFPDGSIQASAVGMTYTSRRFTEVSISPSGTPPLSVLHLNVPAGNYMLFATINLENYADFLFADNNRFATCSAVAGNTALMSGTFKIPGYKEANYVVMSLQGAVTFSVPTAIDVVCGVPNSGPEPNIVRVYSRSLTAMKVGGVEVQP